MGPTIWICGLGLLLTFTGSAAAAAADAADCAAVDDASARLACYDRQHGRRILSGQEADAAAQRPGEGEPRGARATQERTATIVATGRQWHGRHWYRLDNGELWEQNTAGRSSYEVGDRVRIARGALDTHHLRRADGGARSTRVRRVESETDEQG